MNGTLSTQVAIVLVALTLVAGVTVSAQAAPGAHAAFDCSTVTEIPQAECEALVAFYNSANGPGWANHENWLATKAPCGWHGVTCTLGHVTELRLASNQLGGSIPPELSHLSELEVLVLGYNQLSGSIPPDMGTLTDLTYLSLERNVLDGSIPPEMGHLGKLSMLDLHGNRLDGSIPAGLGQMGELGELRLAGNHLSGSIPPELAHLRKLKALDLSSNQLSGIIPAEVGQLPALSTLALSNNQLSGSIPPELTRLSGLQVLDLGSNALNGSIPPQLGQLSQLEYLYLPYNYLGGSIPPELGQLRALRNLNLGHNQLSGSIPAELGQLGRLRELDLSQNRLTGSISPQLAGLHALDKLDLSDNQLTGDIPSELSQIRGLRELDLSQNQLSGSALIAVQRDPRHRVYPLAPLSKSLLMSLPLIALLALIVITYIWVGREPAMTGVTRKLLYGMLVLSVIASALYRVLAFAVVLLVLGMVALGILIGHVIVHTVSMRSLPRVTPPLLTLFVVSDVLLVLSFLFQRDFELFLSETEFSGFTELFPNTGGIPWVERMEDSSYPLLLALIVSWVALFVIAFRTGSSQRAVQQGAAALPPTLGKPAG
ncbi:MAG: leucine-rich repeat domain-containing protein [Anaerolineae bacterium]